MEKFSEKDVDAFLAKKRFYRKWEPCDRKLNINPFPQTEIELEKRKKVEAERTKMSEILQHIYCERVGKVMDKKKQDVQQYLACAKCVDLHQLCSNAQSIWGMKKVEMVSKEKPEGAQIAQYLPQAFLETFLHGGGRLQHEIKTEFHFRAVVDNGYEEEEVNVFLKNASNSILHIIEPISFYNSVEKLSSKE